ncbi:MAG: hypothetical protein A3H49_11910 [Nitrospirae bacterium RIFCSPLOWO2_02_FULL_62_14]|nr:MAG: hypothetical protein A3H49_11910 [Nitrospirae bacterium RIFCSPLOWO2_02_FULL_62_14]OGW68452.1 MAG: hypothetical protein A3A88_11060 [Nitrospirae bacterium RIFCSPLOWO2_01_FULL_62_17]
MHGDAADRSRTSVICEEELDMIYYTCMLVLVGLVTAILGFDGVSAVAIQIAAILFVVEMVMCLATGRTVEAP